MYCVFLQFFRSINTRLEKTAKELEEEVNVSYALLIFLLLEIFDTLLATEFLECHAIQISKAYLCHNE